MKVFLFTLLIAVASAGVIQPFNPVDLYGVESEYVLPAAGGQEFVAEPTVEEKVPEQSDAVSNPAVVQIIININANGAQVAPVVTPESVAIVDGLDFPVSVAEVAPSPVAVAETAEEAVVLPEPVAPVEAEPVAPDVVEPVEVVEAIYEAPQPIQVAAPVMPVFEDPVAVKPVQVVEPMFQ